LVLVARRADRLRDLAEELGGLAHGLPVDLSNRDVDTVAKAVADGLASGKGVIIPGAPNRIASVFNHLLPRRLLLPMVARNHPGLKKP
jgi:short-subunit dehydrogenase